MEKTTLIQAAKLLSLHPNTLKNWQKAGRLPSAEKLKVKGKDVWFVDLDELREVSNNEPIFTQQTSEQTTTNQEPPNGPQEPPTGGFGQSLALWQEISIAPLLKANTDLLKSNDEKSKRIEELALEIGQLRERLRLLETAQAAPQPPQRPEPPPSAEITHAAVEPPQTAQEPEPSPVLHRNTLQPVTMQTKKGFWARWFGG